MIRVWRLCRAKHASEPLSGEGAQVFGGRWNTKGTRMVYCSQSLSLACMEALVHLDLRDLPADFQAIGIDIPDDLPRKVLTASELPRDWRRIPGPERLKELGAAWVNSGQEALLVVPSAVIPEESNILINPDHPDCRRLQAQAPKPFSFDPRFGKA